jgi:hypothetical protein
MEAATYQGNAYQMPPTPCTITALSVAVDGNGYAASTRVPRKTFDLGLFLWVGCAPAPQCLFLPNKAKPARLNYRWHCSFCGFTLFLIRCWNLQGNMDVKICILKEVQKYTTDESIGCCLCMAKEFAETLQRHRHFRFLNLGIFQCDWLLCFDVIKRPQA